MEFSGKSNKDRGRLGGQVNTVWIVVEIYGAKHNFSDRLSFIEWKESSQILVSLAGPDRKTGQTRGENNITNLV